MKSRPPAAEPALETSFPKHGFVSRRCRSECMHNRHHQQDRREVIATLYPSQYLLHSLRQLAAMDSLVEEIATELNGANGQSSRAIYPVSPEVAPEPEG